MAGGAFAGLAHGAFASDHNYSGNCDFYLSDGLIIGDEYSNVCRGGLSPDSFFMKGAADTTHGRGSDDAHRGSTGDDDLLDTQNGDNDRFCDGGGWDEINMQDGDNNDTWYRTADSDNDAPAVKDSNDTVNNGWYTCPM